MQKKCEGDHWISEWAFVCLPTAIGRFVVAIPCWDFWSRGTRRSSLWLMMMTLMSTPMLRRFEHVLINKGRDNI